MEEQQKETTSPFSHQLSEMVLVKNFLIVQFGRFNTSESTDSLRDFSLFSFHFILQNISAV